jgi:hypothetical protein
VGFVLFRWGAPGIDFTARSFLDCTGSDLFTMKHVWFPQAPDFINNIAAAAVVFSIISSIIP